MGEDELMPVGDGGERPRRDPRTGAGDLGGPGLAPHEGVSPQSDNDAHPGPMIHASRARGVTPIG